MLVARLSYDKHRKSERREIGSDERVERGTRKLIRQHVRLPNRGSSTSSHTLVRPPADSPTTGKKHFLYIPQTRRCRYLLRQILTLDFGARVSHERSVRLLAARAAGLSWDDKLVR